MNMGLCCDSRPYDIDEGFGIRSLLRIMGPINGSFTLMEPRWDLNDEAWAGLTREHAEISTGACTEMASRQAE